MKKSGELKNVLKYLQGGYEVRTVLECAEAVITRTINGREERIVLELPTLWSEEQLDRFYTDIDQPGSTLRKCTVWIMTGNLSILASNGNAWLQYDCEYPSDPPVWGYHEDEPGSRRPQVPDSLTRRREYIRLDDI